MIFDKISLDFMTVAQPWLGQLNNDWSLHRHRLRAKLGTEGESRESEREREERELGAKYMFALFTFWTPRFTAVFLEWLVVFLPATERFQLFRQQFDHCIVRCYPSLHWNLWSFQAQF